MKIQALILLCLLGWLSGPSHAAPFPLGTGFSYQGHLTANGAPAQGIFDFYFELFDTPLGGTLLGAQEFEEVEVTNGLFVVELNFGASQFSGQARWLQISVQGTNGLTLLSPRQQLFPVPYALFAPIAGSVSNGAITSTMLATGAITSAALADGSITSSKLGTAAVTTTKLADGSVTSAKLAPGITISNIVTVTNNLALGTTNLNGRLDIYRTSANTPAISLQGGANQISTFGDDGLEQTRLWGPAYGELLLYNGLSANAVSVQLSTELGLFGALTLNNSSGQRRAKLTGADAGGSLLLNNGSGALSVDVRSQFDSGNTAAWVGLNDNGAERISFAARNGSTGKGGLIGVRSGLGPATILLAGDNGFGNPVLSLTDSSANTSARLECSSSAVTFQLRSGGALRAQLVADDISGGLICYGAAGTASILLDGSVGKTTTKVLQITGGSDLSEQFDVQTRDCPLEPGMVVCIDPEHPGQLRVSTRAYDRTVAGIVSGAGGVNPGMLMGQRGTAADGKHPVALTGRVYCLAETMDRAIEPGDLLTTSATAGHAMTASDPAKAQGAILGKAMTRLEKGKGLVLVLVSLQ